MQAKVLHNTADSTAALDCLKKESSLQLQQVAARQVM
jgi:hypothetical protein